MAATVEWSVEWLHEDERDRQGVSFLADTHSVLGEWSSAGPRNMHLHSAKQEHISWQCLVSHSYEIFTTKQLHFRLRSRLWSSGICGRQSGAGAGFLRVLLFPLPIFIPPIAPHSPSPIIWGCYNRPEVAAVQELSPTPLAIKKNICVGVQALFKLHLRNLRGWIAHIHDWKDLWRTPLRWSEVAQLGWAQFAWYTFHIS
jgi:hypothetical protein